MKRWEIPGLAIAIVKDDRVVYARGFGVRELGKPEKVTEKTLFAMASQSKAFTATCAGAAGRPRGSSDWDDPATKYLPWFRMYDPYASRELTVRDLLCHRCGLGTWQGDLMWYGSDLNRREVLERVQFLQPESSFRSRYGYCNLTFVAAGEIIPAIAGVTWEEFIKRRLLRADGDVADHAPTSGEMERRDDVARPHTLVKGKVVPIAYRSTRNTAPAGAINSCVAGLGTVDPPPAQPRHARRPEDRPCRDHPGDADAADLAPRQARRRQDPVPGLRARLGPQGIRGTPDDLARRRAGRHALAVGHRAAGEARGRRR